MTAGRPCVLARGIGRDNGLTRKRAGHGDGNGHVRLVFGIVAQLPVVVRAPGEQLPVGGACHAVVAGGGNGGHRLARQHPGHVHRHGHQALHGGIVSKLPAGIRPPGVHLAVGGERVRGVQSAGDGGDRLAKQHPGHVHRHGRAKGGNPAVVAQLPVDIVAPGVHQPIGGAR